MDLIFVGNRESGIGNRESGVWGDGEMGRLGDGEIGGRESCTFDRNLV
ncbi:MAG: hypothetical protein F6J98_15825 [Moorea sp. SIO4G2]|nr:hypothetical protein [Moorena sp. SIO4G2]